MKITFVQLLDLLYKHLTVYQFSFLILLGQDNVDTTVYAISMALTKYTRDGTGAITSDTYGASKYIEYKPLDLTQPEPAPPQTEVDLSSQYYFIYNINDWVDMINDTFDLLTKDIIQKFQDGSILLSFKKPFVQYDISSGLFSIAVIMLWMLLVVMESMDYTSHLIQDCTTSFHSIQH